MSIKTTLAAAAASLLLGAGMASAQSLIPPGGTVFTDGVDDYQLGPNCTSVHLLNNNVWAAIPPPPPGGGNPSQGSAVLTAYGNRASALNWYVIMGKAPGCYDSNGNAVPNTLVHITPHNIVIQ